MSHRIITAFVALSLVAFACGGSGEADESTTTTAPASQSTTGSEPTTSSSTADTATSTTPDDSTTTTIDDRPRSPLTGLPVDDPTLIDRKLVAVKIDNHPNAQPQSGIESADALIELEVESGWTRFIALFLENDTEWLGPMRSVRPTDSTIVAPLNGVIQMSGGQPWVQRKVLDDGVALIGEIGAPVTMRWNGRNAPHNLYVNTFEIRNHVDERELDPAPPPPLFDWGPLATSAAPHEGDIFFDWTFRVDVTWQWTGSEYIRFVGDEPHEWRTQDGETTDQISADVLVVLKTEQYTACGGSGSCVPASETLGSNEAIVFSGGFFVEGMWERDELSDWFTLTTSDGEVMSVPPGRVFMMLYPDDAEITW